jgi:phosphotransferase system HPr-like phosphotransfer protein
MQLDFKRSPRATKSGFDRRDLIRENSCDPARLKQHRLEEEVVAHFVPGGVLHIAVQLVQVAEHYNDGTRLAIETASGQRVEIEGVLSIPDLLDLSIQPQDCLRLSAKGPTLSNVSKILREGCWILKGRGSNLPPTGTLSGSSTGTSVPPGSAGGLSTQSASALFGRYGSAPPLSQCTALFTSSIPSLRPMR